MCPIHRWSGAASATRLFHRGAIIRHESAVSVLRPKGDSCTSIARSAGGATTTNLALHAALTREWAIVRFAIARSVFAILSTLEIGSGVPRIERCRMKCTHEQYLEAEELSCRRISRSENDGTSSQREWLKTAEAILARRREHLKVCRECGGKK
jgi:hypothetical protein